MYFEIGSRITLKEKVLPFYKKYVIPYCSPVKKDRFEKFEKLLLLCEEPNTFLDKNKIIKEVIPKWDELRMQRGQSNQAFEGTIEAIDFVNNCFGQTQERKLALNEQRKLGSSETTRYPEEDSI